MLLQVVRKGSEGSQRSSLQSGKNCGVVTPDQHTAYEEKRKINTI